MINIKLPLLVDIGARLHDFGLGLFYMPERFPGEETQKLTAEQKTHLREFLNEIGALCKEAALEATALQFYAAAKDLPQTGREFKFLWRAFEAALGSQLAFSIPQHIAPYYEWQGIVGDDVVTAFPKASEEIRAGGSCLALGMYTASVFHAMRAAEIGVRSLGAALKITIKSGKPIELAEWREILDGVAVAVRDIESLPNSTPTKDADLLFYSEAAAQFRFFKNGWRVRVAHARATYTEPQAKETLDHVRSFFETLATRLTE